MTTHTPRANWNTETQAMELDGRTLCGKRSDMLTSGKPGCGQCARNKRTVNGMMHDGSGAFEAKFAN